MSSATDSTPTTATDRRQPMGFCLLVRSAARSAAPPGRPADSSTGSSVGTARDTRRGYGGHRRRPVPSPGAGDWTVLVLAATPIGNLGDAGRRLIETLEAAEVLAVEDTRVAQRLLAGLGIANRPRLVTVNEQTERGRIPELVALAAEGDVVLVSDAGMPAVSDPGFALVRAAVDAGVTVTAVPGASAVLTALAVSGLPTDRFVFEGFAPRR